MTGSLRIGDVLSLTRRGGKPGTRAAELGWYAVRWRVAAFGGGWSAEEVALDDSGRLGPMVVLERLDDNARLLPPGSKSSRSLHSVWWMLHGGGYNLERDGAADG